MRFTGTVFAVLVANLLTIGLLAGAYYYLKSDNGQMVLYEMGLHSFFMASLASTENISDPDAPSKNSSQQGISDMQPMSVMPSSPGTTAPQSAASGSSTEQKENLSAIRSSLKMCRFWTAEYRKDGAQQSKLYRDAACNRYAHFSGRDSANVVSLAGPSYTASAQTSYQEQQAIRDRQRETRQRAQEKRELEEYCGGLSDRIDHYDSLMRQGGSSQDMNRLRSNRRELNLEYSRKCLLGQ